MSEKLSVSLSGVPETLLITLYHRAQESLRADAMLKDDKAVEIVQKLDCDFARFKLQKHDIIGLVCRVREFDRFARDFIASHPDGVVVHIGCGLDTRFERVASVGIEWFDLDLPEVINLRRQLMQEASPHHHLLACSVFDPAWITEVGAYLPRPFLFIAEGVFPYFDKSQIKSLILTLRDNFPAAELVFDAHTPWVMHADNFQLLFSKVNARMCFSLNSGREVETWGKDIRLVEEWFYFGTDEPRVRPYRWMYAIPFLRKSVGIFHYRLG